MTHIAVIDTDKLTKIVNEIPRVSIVAPRRSGKTKFLESLRTKDTMMIVLTSSMKKEYGKNDHVYTISDIKKWRPGIQYITSFSTIIIEQFRNK